MTTKLELIAAMHMRPGDLWAGCYVPEAPTTPVQLWAAAHKITAVMPYRDEAGIGWIRPTAAGEIPGPWGSLTPVRATARVFVIRVRP